MTRTRSGRLVFQWLLIGAAMSGVGAVAVAQTAPAKPATRPVAPAQRVTPSRTSVLEQKQAQPSGVLAGRPDAAEIGGDLLGERFESKGLGLSLRPPRGMTATRKVGSGDVIEFVDTQRNWSLKISKTRMNEPSQLLSRRGADGVMHSGLLDSTLENVRGALGKVDVLRKDVTNVGANDVGLLAIRYTKELQTQLTQQAILQASDRLFYLIALTTPVAQPAATTQPAGAPPAADSREALAAATFRQLLDSTQVLDLTAIRREQDERLIHTRSLLVNFTPARVKAAMVPEQWVRVLQDGKDIGYIYTIEEPASGIPQPLTAEERRAGKTKPNIPAGDGALIGTRSWTMGGDGIEIDSESWMFSTIDLRHEDWTVASVLRKAAATVAHTTEIGVSDRRRNLHSGLDEYALVVTQVDNSTTSPQLSRSLPPFYLPKAMGNLLPRLVPLTQPKGYLFYSYVSDQKELVSRYIDVMPEQRVMFNGQSIRAVLVRDHYGLEGSVTTHYLSPDGKFLGTENKDAKLLMLPTNEATLRGIWKDVKLNRPEGVKNAAQSAAPQPSTAVPAAAAQPAPRTAPPAPARNQTTPARQRPTNAR